MIGYVNGSAVAGLPKTRGPPVFLNPAQATTVASTSPPTRPHEVTDPWTCSLQRRRSRSKKFAASARPDVHTCTLVQPGDRWVDLFTAYGQRGLARP